MDFRTCYDNNRRLIPIDKDRWDSVPLKNVEEFIEIERKAQRFIKG